MKNLKRLLRIPRTAKELARLMECSIPTAHRRLARLRRDGVRLTETKAWSKNTGPVPRKFSLVEARTVAAEMR